jgi:hypothetical protein
VLFNHLKGTTKAKGLNMVAGHIYINMITNPGVDMELTEHGELELMCGEVEPREIDYEQQYDPTLKPETPWHETTTFGRLYDAFCVYVVVQNTSIAAWQAAEGDYKMAAAMGGLAVLNAAFLGLKYFAKRYSPKKQEKQESEAEQ